MNSRSETILDIVSVASILYKFGFDELVDNQTTFINVLNQLGFTTTSGKVLTKMNYRMMVARLDDSDRENVANLLEMDIIHIWL